MIKNSLLKNFSLMKMYDWLGNDFDIYIYIIFKWCVLSK